MGSFGWGMEFADIPVGDGCSYGPQITDDNKLAYTE